eukprot:CAMPEP_0206287300 /NCGR_PEP_ID=MMETSP0106_2-20121207/1037_1 /ASSEMBLY_ACC=CAM_ASM_000206 /TAXON_ID=81532 /ORGANISM="Acanthoeca-like sp., Strain 10tr" /LENGTH=500 /DNA_ID=CAMNT_0053717833 /DNA_START=123 /DNA_END=1625 /DNA_ORIENTATION=+
MSILHKRHHRQPSSVDAIMAAAPQLWEKGASVELHSLVKRTDLNGVVAVVVSGLSPGVMPRADTRIKVRLPAAVGEGSKELSIKLSNVSLAVGDAPLRTLVPQQLDPRTLAEWGPGRTKQDAFADFFTIEERILLSDPDNEEIMVENPNFELRAILFELSKVGDRKLIAVQNKAQTSGVMLLTCGTKYMPAGEAGGGYLPRVPGDEKDTGVPIIEVLWSFNTRAETVQPEGKQQIEELLNGLARQAESRMVCSLEAHGDKTIDQLHELLRKNRGRLPPDYVAAAEEGQCDGVYYSVIAPVEAKAVSRYACGTCGNIPAQPKWCAGCLAVAYCNVACQTKHWKELGHKQGCARDAKKKKAETEAGDAGNPGKVFRIDLSRQDLMTEKKGYVQVMCVRGGGSAITNTPKDQNQLPKKALGTETVVKVQVQPCRDMALVYDKSRKWQLQVDNANAVGGLAEICHLVRTHGIMGGKGYFRARLPKKQGGIVEIIFDKMLPARPW